MEENNITEDSEKSEQTVSDEALKMIKEGIGANRLHGFSQRLGRRITDEDLLTAYHRMMINKKKAMKTFLEDKKLGWQTYMALPVREQQIQQLDEMIEQVNADLESAKRIPEDGFDKDGGEYFGDYINTASSFFNEHIGYTFSLLQHTAEIEMFNGSTQPTYCMESMLFLLGQCKENPNTMLSGEYPGGGKMKEHGLKDLKKMEEEYLN